MPPITEGGFAPDFELNGIDTGDRDRYRLREEMDRGNAVVLLFYPFDFDPVSATELCDAEWFRYTEDVTVWGISSDSLYAHRAFADQHHIGFPLLTDHAGTVAERYGVKYDWWDGHADVPKRAVYLVDADQRVAYQWHTDDAYEVPNITPLHDAVKAVGNDGNGVDTGDELELAVDYSDTSEER